MSKGKWASFIAGVIALFASTFLGVSIWGGATPHAPGGGTEAGVQWIVGFFTTLLGGAGLTLPGVIAFIKAKVLPLLGTRVDPRIGSVLDVGQIGAYLYLLDKAKTPEERAALITAGRATCDGLKDSLFPEAK